MINNFKKTTVSAILFLLVFYFYPSLFARIAVDAKKGCFMDTKTGNKFFPYGVNYDHNSDFLLIENFWDKTDEIDRVFKEIKQMGFNIVRIHLQQFVFQCAVDKFSQEALLKLDSIVNNAAAEGLYLDVTGLGRYNGKIPEWYRNLTDEERIKADKNFWRVLASRFKGNEAIFCFDIQNEPVINREDKQGFVGPSFEDGYHYINRHFQDIKFYWNKYLKEKYSNVELFKKSWLIKKYHAYPEFSDNKVPLPDINAVAYEREEFRVFIDFLAILWLKPISEEIKKIDKSRLVTLGLSELNFSFNKYYASFSPLLIKPYVDFISIHVYPREISKEPYKDNADEVLRIIKCAYMEKPVIIEEIYPLVPMKNLYANFIKPAQKYVNGWISFYWGVPINKLKESDKIGDKITADWLEYFSKNKNEILERPDINEH